MTEILPADPSGISRAATLLQQGALVALPTETVYGLGADARNGTAVAGIYEAKGRPSFNPLIIHVADVDQARRYGRWTDTAEILASAFWPGPMTLVLPLADGHAPFYVRLAVRWRHPRPTPRARSAPRRRNMFCQGLGGGSPLWLMTAPAPWAWKAPSSV